VCRREIALHEWDKVMTLEDAKKIVANSEDGELEVRENYSGRGMYGKTTVGVVGYQSDIQEAAQAAGVRVSSLKWDRMGKLDIAY